MGKGPDRLIVMRHLHSLANAQGLLAGTLDVPLSVFGIQEAPAARKQMDTFAPFGVVFSSDKKRTVSTARRVTGQNPRRTVLLRERHLGELEGTPVTQEFVNKLYTPYSQRQTLVMASGAETDMDMMTRWDQFLDRWRQASRGITSLAVSHSSMMGTLLDDLKGKDAVHAIQNGGYFVLEAQGNPKSPNLHVVESSGIIYPFKINAAAA